MKKLLLVASLLLSSLSFAAEIKRCELQGQVVEKAVVPSEQTVSTIKTVLRSEMTEEGKRKIIKSALFIDGASIGDGTSFCELVKVEDQKCLKALTSSDVADALFDEDFASEDLGCVIGVTTMLFLSVF